MKRALPTLLFTVFSLAACPPARPPRTALDVRPEPPARPDLTPAAMTLFSPDGSPRLLLAPDGAVTDAEGALVARFVGDGVVRPDERPWITARPDGAVDIDGAPPLRWTRGGVARPDGTALTLRADGRAVFTRGGETVEAPARVSPSERRGPALLLVLIEMARAR